jgi:nifR3 family TIM-barrel protein
MSGVTDSAFRRLVKHASGDAVGLLVTEFVSVEGLTRKNLRTVMRLSFDRAVERPLAVQIFGSEPERMGTAAAIAEEAGADMVDVNCGCPVPKVVRKGGGADLHRDLSRLARILTAIRSRISVPLTLKMRSGWDDDSRNAVEMAQVAVDCGVQLLSVHGRTRVQLYSGDADWSIVGAVARAVPVPVLGSGDVTTPEGGLARLLEAGCAGLMIGRGAIMNPWIFRQIVDLQQGRPPLEPSLREKLDLLYLYRDLLAEALPARALPGRIKMMMARFAKSLPDGANLRHTVLRGQDLPEIFGRIEEYFASLERHDPALSRPANTVETGLDADHVSIVTA